MLELLPDLIRAELKSTVHDVSKARLMTDFGFKTGWDVVADQFYERDGEWYLDTIQPRQINLKEAAFAVRRSWLRDRAGTIFEVPKFEDGGRFVRRTSRIDPLKAQRVLKVLEPASLYPVFTYETFAGWPNRVAFVDEAQCILAKMIIDDHMEEIVGHDN